MALCGSRTFEYSTLPAGLRRPLASDLYFHLGRSNNEGGVFRSCPGWKLYGRRAPAVMDKRAMKRAASLDAACELVAAGIVAAGDIAGRLFPLINGRR